MLEVKHNNFTDSEKPVRRYEALHILKGDMTHKWSGYLSKWFPLLCAIHP